MFGLCTFNFSFTIQRENQQQMFAKIKRGEFHEAPLNSYDISEDGRDFLQCCLQVNPKLRMTAAEALKHKWLQDLYEEDSVKSLSLSQSQSQQSRKIDNGIHIESLSKIDEDVMLRPLIAKEIGNQVNSKISRYPSV